MNNATKPILAQRLRAARQALIPEVTQRDVAKRLDLSASAVNLWETGKTEPSSKDLVALAKWFGVSVDWLLGADGRNPVASPAADGAPVYTVPVVPPTSMTRWKMDVVLELLQTAISYPPQTAAAMVVASDSMPATAPAGSYVVVSKSHAAEPGAVVLALAGTAKEPVLRKLVREGGVDLLVPDDNRFPTLRLADGARVVGRVTEVTTRRVLV